MTDNNLLSQVRGYYDEKLRTHGPTARGVDWNSAASQELRFTQLVQVIDTRRVFSVNDYGCGYGALVDYLERASYEFQYVGFDISPLMLAKARELHAQSSGVRFVSEPDGLSPADYTLASGIFNVRLEADDAAWTDHMLDVLQQMNALSQSGFAFNALTRYSDPEFMRSDLYYGDPLLFFDYCKKHFSRFVTLVHDYPLYEFTILVRKA